MHKVLVNRLGGLSLPRKSVVRLTDRPDMTLDVYRGRKTTMQQQQQQPNFPSLTLDNTVCHIKYHLAEHQSSRVDLFNYDLYYLLFSPSQAPRL